MAAILELIWRFVGPYIVEIAVSVGLPKALEWLLSKGWPKWIVDGLISIAKGALEEITKIKDDPELSPSDARYQIKEVKRGARVAARQHCSGAGCPTGLARE